ncbi:MAG: hypothetical protein WA304_10560 [Candidatus Cybelea sp.]
MVTRRERPEFSYLEVRVTTNERDGCPLEFLESLSFLATTINVERVVAQPAAVDDDAAKTL